MTCPTDEQRAEWLGLAHDQHAVVDDLCACDSLIDAIFAAGAKVALDGMTVEWGVRLRTGYAMPCGDRPHVDRMLHDFADVLDGESYTRRVTDWQPADD